MKWPGSLSRLQYSRVESNVKTSSKVPNSTYPVRYTVYACQLPNSVNTSVEMAGGCQTGRGRYVLHAGRRGQSRTPAEGPWGQRGGAGLGSPWAAGGRTESDFPVKETSAAHSHRSLSCRWIKWWEEQSEGAGGGHLWNGKTWKSSRKNRKVKGIFGRGTGGKQGQPKRTDFWESPRMLGAWVSSLHWAGLHIAFFRVILEEAAVDQINQE